MTMVLSFTGYFLVGFIEMFMATQRTYWISKGRSSAAAFLVFFESLIGMFVILQIVSNLHDNLWLIVAFAAGNAVGTFINLEKVPF